MKKLVLMFVAVAAISFASCGGKTEKAANADTTGVDSIAQVDTTNADTTNVDTTAAVK